MKKIILITLILVGILAGCSSNTSTNKIKYVGTDELMEKLDNKESFFLVIGNSTCSACIQYKPTLEELVKNKDVELFYLEVDTEGAKSDAHRENVVNFFENYLEDKVNSTPSTIYFSEGKMDELRVGLVKYSDLTQWFESK